MKKKVLIGVALLMVVPLLVGCGGVSQEDYDAAVADLDDCKSDLASLQSNLDAANSAKTTAESALADCESDLETTESDLSAAQSAKTSAQSALAAAKATITDLEAQIAALEAAEEEEEEEGDGDGDGGDGDSSGLSFTAATYTNADYGFSLQYPDSWTEKTDDPAVGVIWRVGDPATYSMPSVRVIVRDEADGATLQDVFAKVLESDGKATTTFTASDVTINDTDFSKGEIVYPHASYGDYDGIVIGLKQGGKWIIIEVYTLPGLGAVWPSEGLKAEIIGTVTFD